MVLSLPCLCKIQSTTFIYSNLFFSKRESAEWRHGDSQCRRENTSSPMGDHWQVSKKPSPENQIRDFGRWGGDRLASVNTEHGDNIGLLIHDKENWGISLNQSLLKYEAKEASFYYVYICLSCPFYDFYFYKILIWWRMVSSHFIWSIQYISYWLHLRNVPMPVHYADCCLF